MLNSIKAMIKEKQEFIEASQMIIEDAMDMDMDDSIVLGKEEDEPEKVNSEENGSEENIIKPDDENKTIEPVSSDENHDVLDEPVEESEPVTGNDDLPTPVGAQTEIPITGNVDDILDTTIDLKSNTINDVLPIPPANANEAIAGESDIITQKVDSGFGKENDTTSNDESDIVINQTPSLESANFNITDIKKIHKLYESKYADHLSFDQFLEAIDLGSGETKEDNNNSGNNNSSSEGASNTSDNKDDNTAPDAGLEEQPVEENPVTSAVKDKVAEADATTEPDTNISEDNNSEKNVNDEIFKRLSNLTKNIEDAKKLVLDSLNK